MCLYKGVVLVCVGAGGADVCACVSRCVSVCREAVSVLVVVLSGVSGKCTPQEHKSHVEYKTRSSHDTHCHFERMQKSSETK